LSDERVHVGHGDRLCPGDEAGEGGGYGGAELVVSACAPELEECVPVETVGECVGCCLGGVGAGVWALRRRDGGGISNRGMSMGVRGPVEGDTAFRNRRSSSMRGC